METAFTKKFQSIGSNIFIRFVSVSVLSALIDNLLFIAVYWLSANLLVSQIFGRVFSMLFNYAANSSAVFQAKKKIIYSMPMYLGLAIFMLMTSHIFIYITVNWLNINIIVTKLSVESILFILSYFVQKWYIFNADKYSSFKESARKMTNFIN